MPFCRTKVERVAKGDQRRSIEERYSSHEDWIQRVQRCRDARIKKRLILEEDARSRNPLDPSVPLVAALVAPDG